MSEPRKPVAMDANGRVVVCDDGTVWQWKSDYGNLTDPVPGQYGRGWTQCQPIPGTAATIAPDHGKFSGSPR